MKYYKYQAVFMINQLVNWKLFVKNILSQNSMSHKESKNIMQYFL